MTQQGERRTVAAMVKDVGEDERGGKASLLIEGFGKFPILVNRIPSEDHEQLQAGRTYNVTLQKGRLKQGKDGQYLNNFWWEWVGLAAAGSAPIGPSESGEARDGTRVSIERQKALDLAVQWSIHKDTVEHAVRTVDVLAVAHKFAKYLEDGMVPTAAQETQESE